MTPDTDSVCEESTYTTIFREYSKVLYNYLFYKTGNLNLAKDLTQEAFTKLWLNCKSVIPQSAKGYVFKTANNLLINEFHHQKVVLKFQSLATSDSDHQSPAFLLEEKELKENLESAIAALPEKQRLVFLLSRIDKKTYKEIAVLLDISKQAVEKRMYNALDALRLVSKNIR
jgi:RNA polymerase sigma factor (sigma-70 family)